MKSFNLMFDNSWAWVTNEVNVNKGKDVTLVTIGDSFTWGDELNGACGIRTSPNDHKEYREAHCYGKLLSDMLDSNWVQQALPGGSNDWCLLEIKKLIPQLIPQTKKIIVVCTLTEPLREFDSESIDPTLLKIVTNIALTGGSIREIIQASEKLSNSQLTNFEMKWPDVDFYYGYGFTFPLIDDINSNFLTTWNEVALDSVNIRDYPKLPVFRTGTWVITQWLKENNFLLEKHLDETSVLYDQQNKYAESMLTSGLFYERYHPTEIGHKLWAEYIYSKITK